MKMEDDQKVMIGIALLFACTWLLLGCMTIPQANRQESRGIEKELKMLDSHSCRTIHAIIEARLESLRLARD